MHRSRNQGLQTAETARRLAHTIDGHALLEGDTHKVTHTGRMLALWFGKLLPMAGVILLVLAVLPMDDFGIHGNPRSQTPGDGSATLALIWRRS